VSIDSIAGPVVAIHETVEPIGNGALIFDSSLMSGVSEQTFAAAGWKSVRKIEDVLHSGGRGNTLILGDGRREYVLRHFRRGGLVGRLIRDTYLWLGEDRTRSFAEWRILQKLYNRGLPVPRPAVARYRRYGVFYTADIITVRIPGIRSLSARLAAQPFPARLWQRIGAGISAFHEQGVNHADLNAHNVQIDDHGRLWLLDFDKATIMPAGAWRQANLARLHRSLRKIKGQHAGFHYSEHCWEALIAGYFQASRSS